MMLTLAVLFALAPASWVLLWFFAAGAAEGEGGSLLLLISVVFALVMLPALSMQVRRLHDVGKSGWWSLLGFFPVMGIGGLILGVFCSRPSEVSTNKYGPNPYGIGNEVIPSPTLTPTPEQQG